MKIIFGFKQVELNDSKMICDHRWFHHALSSSWDLVLVTSVWWTIVGRITSYWTLMECFTVCWRLSSSCRVNWWTSRMSRTGWLNLWASWSVPPWHERTKALMKMSHGEDFLLVQRDVSKNKHASHDNEISHKRQCHPINWHRVALKAEEWWHHQKLEKRWASKRGTLVATIKLILK